jgi:hypothetical protein
MTPAERWAETPPAINLGVALPAPAHIATTMTTSTGMVAAGRYLIGIGTRWAGHQARIHYDQTHAAVFINHQLVRALALDPTRRYQPIGKPRNQTQTPTITCQG